MAKNFNILYILFRHFKEATKRIEKYLTVAKQQVVCAFKEPYHRNALGYISRGAPKIVHIIYFYMMRNIILY